MNAPLPNLETDLDLLSAGDLLMLLDAISAHVKRRTASSKEDELVCLKAAAQATGLSCDTIVRRIKANPALGRKLGGRWFVSLGAWPERRGGPF